MRRDINNNTLVMMESSARSRGCTQTQYNHNHNRNNNHNHNHNRNNSYRNNNKVQKLRFYCRRYGLGAFWCLGWAEWP